MVKISTSDDIFRPPAVRAGVAQFAAPPHSGETRLRQALVLALTLPALALATEPDPRFTKLWGSAESLTGLGSFLEKYVGDCKADEVGAVECRQNAEAFRRKSNGKRMKITTDDAAVVQMGKEYPDGEFTLNIVPFFGAGGSAVTHGAPSKADANGNPVLPFLTVKGTAPDGADARMVARMITMRALRLQVIFTPQGMWALNTKNGKVSGVKARIEAILVSVARTGEPIGLWMPKG